MIAFLTALALLLPQPATPAAAAAPATVHPATASAMRWHPGAPKIVRPAAAMRWHPGTPKTFRWNVTPTR